MIRKIYKSIQKDAVLSVSVILAVLSVFIIKPDKSYLSYIDFRTLSLLFCLMTIVSGLREMGIFDLIAENMLSKAHGAESVITLLVLLCFFFSMLITNDVALITFVPLALIILHKFPEAVKQYWILRVVSMQTIAANLGSMLTPIGNPQNLFLYAKAGISALALIRLMLPYSAAALILLLLWIRIAAFKAPHLKPEEAACFLFSAAERKRHLPKKGPLTAYLLLFAACLLTVVRILDFRISLLLVLLYAGSRNRELFRRVDYSLLVTFTALFIFIGNIARITGFSHFLGSVINGHEIWTAILASQIMSNVPAAVLLSGFTEDYRSLIIGTDIGGLGTLIASMASLISFKCIAKEYPDLRGKYLLVFTVSNLIFLALMILIYFLQETNLLRMF